MGLLAFADTVSVGDVKASKDAETQISAPKGSTVWKVAVPLVAVAAGFLVVSGAATAHGTDLRAERRTQLTDLISARQLQILKRNAEISRLQGKVNALSQSSQVATDATSLEAQAGLTPLTGAGLKVELNDAPRSVQVKPGAGVRPDDLVVHQQDVQAVVNALWSGGAQGITVMDQRLISTSAVRCVGNTLILQGRVYSPPFVVSAVGDPGAMRKALAASPQVAAYRTWVDAVGLGYREIPVRTLTLPGYSGSIKLIGARSGT